MFRDDHGDIWSAPSVTSMLNAFERGEFRTVADLQVQLTEHVGLKVPLSVLNAKLKEMVCLLHYRFCVFF